MGRAVRRVGPGRVGRRLSEALGIVVSRGITPKQAEVLDLLAAGMTNQEIADKLGMSVRTVSVHLRTAYLRLGVHNRNGAVAAWLGQPSEPTPTEAMRALGYLVTP